MIISASRRTDIPAFYPEWFMNRVRAGYCTVPNPFNVKQVSRLSLLPDAVEAVVFWTRNPSPLLPRLQELDERGLAYYFLFTLVNNPKAIDPHSPSLAFAVAAFQRLVEKIGPERVIWRYDPIVFSSITPAAYHLDNYGSIAEKLAGYTKRSVISFVEDYRKSGKRIARLRQNGIVIRFSPAWDENESDRLVCGLVHIAGRHGIEVLGCAQKRDLTHLGVRPGKCIDDDLLRNLFHVDVPSGKDPAQRRECGCVPSRDIGMYDSCLFGCSYCYATRSFELAGRNHRAHNPASPSLLGWHDVEGSSVPMAANRALAAVSRQPHLF